MDKNIIFELGNDFLKSKKNSITNVQDIEYLHHIRSFYKEVVIGEKYDDIDMRADNTDFFKAWVRHSRIEKKRLCFFIKRYAAFLEEQNIELDSNEFNSSYDIAERQIEIAKAIHGDGIAVDDLAEMFMVDGKTIQNDLRDIEADGLNFLGQI